MRERFKFLLSAGIMLSIIMGCGCIKDRVINPLTEEIERLRNMETEKYEGNLIFGYYDHETGEFDERDEFTDAQVLNKPMNAMLYIDGTFGVEKLKIEIFRIWNTSESVVDRYTEEIDSDWGSFIITLPIYRAGIFRIEISTPDDELIGIGEIEVKSVP